MTKCLIKILYFDFVFLYFCNLYSVNFDTNINLSVFDCDFYFD